MSKAKIRHLALYARDPEKLSAFDLSERGFSTPK